MKLIDQRAYEMQPSNQGFLALAVRSVRTTGEGYFVMAITMAHTASTFTRRAQGATVFFDRFMRLFMSEKFLIGNIYAT